MIKNIAFGVFILVSFLSCSSDNANPEDKITSVTATINGVPMTFQAYGYGIDLTNNGYKLGLNFGRSVASPFEEYGFYLEMRYKKKGNNVIEKFIYHQGIIGNSFDGDFVDGTFENTVSVNKNSRFKATASGSLTIGDKTVTITDLKINYVYEDPFDSKH
ncbi:hypothetical protein [Flavobacterium sp. 25HG05S-40]|uniref:hypothetical protein n=1 Tax=Flavobacterium sp. 25HG05S-40 TaxID=3458682 RepID=UPI004043B12F